ncbi:MAG: hypothetical protein IKQ60_06430 [Candidatus Methanomethylophilaceae archaeon]|nr:hypothetical protein [Candidatus Methanomethylophilaceae archaeon]
MKALVNQRTGEVYWEDGWLPWISRATGLPLALRSRGYAYCAEATSENAADYTVSEVREEDEDGFEVVRLVAVQRAEE